MSNKNQTVRNLRVSYTDAERLALGRQLADVHKDLEQAQADKKSVVSDFSARIKSHEAKIVDLAGKVSNGYQVKEVLCEWRFNQPKEGLKTLVRLDTGETVETLDMIDADKQGDLPLADPDGGETAKTAVDSDPETGVVTVDADKEDET